VTSRRTPKALSVLLLERYTVDPSRISRFEELAGERVGSLRDTDGCLWSELSRAADDEVSYVLLSEWRSVAEADGAPEPDGAFDAVLQSEITRRSFASVD
jgi:hypothetical protein